MAEDSSNHTAEPGEGDYSDHARRLSKRAAEEHGRWFAGLSEDDQKRVVELKLDSYGAETFKLNDREDDAAELPQASLAPAAFVEALPDVLRERFDLDEEQANGVASLFGKTLERMADQQKAFLLGRIIGGLLQPGNVQIRVYGLAFAAGLDQLNGLGSMEEAGSQCRPAVGRAAISKVKREWQVQLDLPDGAHSKSPEARAKYSENGKTNHWRHQKWNSSKTPQS